MSKHVFEHANRCQCYMMPYFFLDATKFGLLSFFTLIETIARTFGQNHRRRTQKFHFWLACVAQRRLCLNSLNWFQFCFPLYINFNKKYDVVQNFLLKVLQSQTKVVGILPPNAVFFFCFWPVPSSYKCYLSQLTLQILHTNIGREKR